MMKKWLLIIPLLALLWGCLRLLTLAYEVSGWTLSASSYDLCTQHLARNPTTPWRILAVFAKDKESMLPFLVAGNANTWTTTLQTLAKSEDFWTRRAVASNSNTPVETLQFLSEDKSFQVRKAIAWNPNTPIELLKILAYDESANVRTEIITNPSTPAAVLQILTNVDVDGGNVGGRAGYGGTPTDILQKVVDKYDTCNAGGSCPPMQ